MRKLTETEAQSEVGQMIEKAIAKVNRAIDTFNLNTCNSLCGYYQDKITIKEEYMDGAIDMAKLLTNTAYKATRSTDGSGHLELVIG